MDWDKLQKECTRCTRCSLCETRTNVVFGVGIKDAEVLFIGEGPGEQEDLQGEPFVGRAGRLLDEMVSIIGLNRHKNCYIANIVKCRPPKNRDPLAVEQEACIGWLNKQIEILSPKIIVCLGRISAQKMIKEDFKITQEHGLWFLKGGAQMMALYHPAALLRDVHKKPDTFADIKGLQAKIKELCPRTYEMCEVELEEMFV